MSPSTDVDPTSQVETVSYNPLVLDGKSSTPHSIFLSRFRGDVWVGTVITRDSSLMSALEVRVVSRLNRRRYTREREVGDVLVHKRWTESPRSLVLSLISRLSGLTLNPPPSVCFTPSGEDLETVPTPVSMSDLRIPGHGFQTLGFSPSGVTRRSNKPL